MAHRISDDSCCTRLQHSTECATVRHGGMVILAALSIIALFGGLVLLMAQSGYNLGAINALAQSVPPQWIYFGIGLGFIALTVDAVFITAQLHNYLKK